MFSKINLKGYPCACFQDNFMDAEIVTLEELLWQARYELHQVGSEVLPKKEAKVHVDTSRINTAIVYSK